MHALHPLDWPLDGEALVINCIIGSWIFGFSSELTRLLGRASPIAMIVLIMRIIYFLIALAAIIPLILAGHHAERKSRSLVTSSPGTWLNRVAAPLTT